MKPGERNLLIVIAAVVVVLTIVVVVLQPFAPKTVRQPGTQLSVDEAAGLARIDMALIGTKATWYSYNTTGGAEMRVFAVKDSNGGMHVALDACDVCYRANRGYSQSGEYVVCGNCGMRFPIEGIGDVNTGTGCWPSHVPYVVKSGYAEIKLSDLEGKAWMFP